MGTYLDKLNRETATDLLYPPGCHHPHALTRHGLHSVALALQHASCHVMACPVMCNVMSNHWFVFSPVLLLTLWVAVVGSAAPGAAEKVGLEEGPQKILTLTLYKVQYRCKGSFSQ